MTIREITELRKSGHLQEALEAAEKELAQNINVYTVGGVFWCLNDLYKQQNSSDAKATVEHTGAVTEPWLKETSGEIRLRTDRKGRSYAIISGS